MSEQSIDPPATDRFTLVRRAASGWRSWLAVQWQKRWFRWASLAAGGALLSLAAIWLVFARDLPSVQRLVDYQPPLPTNVRTIDGSPIHSYARERRVELRFEEYPRILVNAFLSAEDKTFFDHGGLDYPGLVRAAFEGITRNETPRGTSTITQQVAKNLLLTNEVSYVRKLREAILAMRIERALSKEQILELYLNQIALGRNSFGVQAASRAYFDKDVDQLALHEAAYLAILPKAPSTYSRARNADRAIERRNWVLGEMARNGFITGSERDAAAALPLGLVAVPGRRSEQSAGYFIEEVRRQLIARFGESSEGGQNSNSVYDGGLWVRTSLDPAVQEHAARALRDALVRYDRGKGWSGPVLRIEPGEGWRGRLAAANLGGGYPDWLPAVVLAKSSGSAEIGFADGSTGSLPASAAQLADRRRGGTAFAAMQPGDVILVRREGGGFALRNLPEISGGMVVQDPRTGRVMAMQGGFDSRIQSFNRATQALRQPGSSIKPFVYAAALDNGLTPASIIVDGPFCVYQSALLGQKCFRNFGGGSGAGPQTMRWGLEQSRNLMTVRAASQTGMDEVTRTIERMGIGKYDPVLSIALGAGDTTVMKLTNAFSMLANHGRQLRPTLIDLVQDRSGKTIFRADNRPCPRCNARDWDGKPMPRPPQRGRQLMDAMTAYQVVHMLEGVIERGTATTLRDLNRPIFGKTGTSTGPTNVWFVGGSADMVAGVYLGFDQPRSLGGYAQGGTVAAPIFKQFAQAAMKDMAVVPFRAPAGIRMVRIDRRSGRKVFGAWPTDEPRAAVIWEAFKPESEPRRVVRRDELAADRERTAAAEDRAIRSGQRDSDFLQREGGIY